MHRWIHLLGALAFVLLLWTGGTARAAEGYIPIAVAAESVGHFAGDKDEVPSDQHNGVPHHHFACGEHAATTWSNAPAPMAVEPIGVPVLARSTFLLDGREPDGQLRPPIA